MVAAAGLALLVFQIAYEIVAPIGSDDVWWHLALGEAYRSQGPWLEADPLLYTATQGPPPPHSWLFDAGLSAVDALGGSAGLRLAHLAMALLILALAYAVLRRECGERAIALAATTVLLLLMAERLARLRPDLVSIGAAILLYALLLAGEGPPSWRRVAAAAGLVGLWANFHAAFGVGPLLLFAALLGIGLRALLLRLGLGAADPEAPLAEQRAWAVRIGAALVLGLLVALFNPRGVEQHLSYLISSGAQAIGAISDDWQPFDPRPGGRSLQALGLGPWLAANLLGLLFVACAVFAVARLARIRSPEALRAADPVKLALGAAACVAALVSQRFLWMSVFPLLFVLRTLEAFGAGRTACLGAAILALGIGLFETRSVALPTRGQLRPMLARPFSDKYPVDAVAFLAETGLNGHLFGRYSTSGFYGYWLAPGLRTMVNGSLNFPSSVFTDYFAIVNAGGVPRGESFRDALDRQQVDVFLGTGTPEEILPGGKRFYTTLRLEGEPGWVLVSRGPGHSIHLRRSARNAENLERVAAYYERAGVPFDRDAGLDVGQVIETRPDWAIEKRVLPRRYAALREAAASDDPATAFEALGWLATLHLMLGDYERQVGFDLQALALGPSRQGPRRRLVFGLLRLGRSEEALSEARAMGAIDPDDPVAAAFLRAAELRLEAGRARGPRADAVDAFVLKLPVLSWRSRVAVESMLAPRPALSRARAG